MNARDEADEARWSHSVRVWALRTNKGKKHTTYSVRWMVGGQEQHQTYASYALGDAFRAKLLTHIQKGSAFEIASGLPAPMLREANERSWYEHMCAYVDMKWPGAAPKSRTGIADSLATITPALLSSDRGQPDAALIREALYGWALVSPRRRAGEPPGKLASTVRWLDRNTVPLTALSDRTRRPVLVRQALDALSRRVTDGRPAAPKTIARKRAILHNALEYAVELGHLDENPLRRVAWKAPKTAESVDRRVVVDRRRARTLLMAVACSRTLHHGWWRCSR